MCGQQQEDEHHGKRERRRGGVAHDLLLQRDLGPFESEAGRQIFRDDLFHRGDRLACRKAGQRRPLDLGRRKQVVARNAVGSGHVAEGRNSPERHHVPGHGPGPQILNIPDREPERVVGLRRHPIGPPQDVEVVHEGRPHVGRQGVEEARDRDAQHLGLGAVDVGVDLRRRRIEKREDLDQAGCAVRRTRDRIGRLFEGARPATGTILDIHLETAAGSDARHRWRRDHQHESLAQSLRLATQVIEDGVRRETGLHPLLEWFQGDEDHPGIGSAREGRSVEARERHRVGHTGARKQELRCALNDPVRPLEARARRQGDCGDEVAAIERRDEARGRAAELIVGQADQAGIDHQHERRHAQHPARQSGIAGRQPFEQSVETGEKNIERLAQGRPEARLCLLAMRSQEQRRQGGRQRQRHDGRDDRRGRDRERKLPIELARNAGDERRRDEYGAEHQRDRDQRASDLVHGLVRGLARGHPLAQIALDVLDDHDGIVDHDADRKHQAEQREVVQREAEARHHEERADQRDRDGDDGDDRGAPGLQEQDDDDHHQHDRLEQRPDHLVDRLLDEPRRVVGDAIAQPRREALGQLIHRRADGGGGRERVRAGPLKYPDCGRDLVVEIGVPGVVLGAELDARDVAYARDATVRIRGHDDVGELLRSGQAAERLDRDLKTPRRGGGRLIDRPGRDLHVGGAQGGNDVAGGETARLRLGGIEPHPHGVVACAEHDRIPDPIEAGQDVLDVHGHVVGDVLLVERSIRRDEVDHHHQVGRLLAHRHADALHLVRQSRHRHRHAVLHQHLRLVDVRSRLEDHVDRQRPVSRRLRHHVDHVVDAIDLLLDGRRDRRGNDFRHCAGKGRGHLHGRWRDIGILADRERAEGDGADERQDDRKNARENRSIDEEM